VGWTGFLHLPPALAADQRRRADCWVPWLAEVFADNPDRYEHSLAVWRRAVEVRRVLPVDEREVLVLAALLHDIGRAGDPGNRRPHGFVGAQLLDAAGLPDVAAVVAHHSGARFEAHLRGMAHHDRWDPPRHLVDLLTYLDRTTSSTGTQVTLTERRAELEARYGAESRNVLVFDLSLPDALRGKVLATPRARRTA
jgi:putative nucleotidyltransferase with HDIG domain